MGLITEFKWLRNSSKDSKGNFSSIELFNPIDNLIIIFKW